MEGRYSVLFSVYKKENPLYFLQSVESMVYQTLPPTDIVIVCDGPLTKELEDTIASFQKKWPALFSIDRLPENRGLGSSLQRGVLLCKEDWIARMDTDDIACHGRCAQQVEAVKKRPDLVLLGGQIAEFEGDVNHIVARREVPCGEEAVKQFAKRRNPFNHMTVFFQKEAVLACGNYREMPGFEDYDLWIRLIQGGYILDNLPEVLVYARAGSEMVARRGGFSYVKKINRFLKSAYRSGFFTKKEYQKSRAVRTLGALVPGRVRESLYRRFLRQKNT